MRVSTGFEGTTKFANAIGEGPPALVPTVRGGLFDVPNKFSFAHDGNRDLFPRTARGAAPSALSQMSSSSFKCGRISEPLLISPPLDLRIGVTFAPCFPSSADAISLDTESAAAFLTSSCRCA